MPDTGDHYVLAGIDLRAFVADWIATLESGGGEMRGLLEHARTDPDVRQRYSYGATRRAVLRRRAPGVTSARISKH